MSPLSDVAENDVVHEIGDRGVDGAGRPEPLGQNASGVLPPYEIAQIFGRHDVEIRIPVDVEDPHAVGAHEGRGRDHVDEMPIPVRRFVPLQNMSAACDDIDRPVAIEISRLGVAMSFIPPIGGIDHFEF